MQGIILEKRTEGKLLPWPCIRKEEKEQQLMPSKVNSSTTAVFTSFFAEQVFILNNLYSGGAEMFAVHQHRK